MALLCVVSLLSVGCGSYTDTLYADYLNRLDNALGERPPSEWHPGPPEPAPSVNDWRVNIPDLRATPLAIWRLRHCELFDLVSERNSILGRVAEPALRWHYEARIRYTLSDCLADNRTSESSAGDLREWQQEKKKTWNRSVWNGTFGTHQVRDVWRVSQQGLDPGNLPALAPLEQAVARLADWARTWPDKPPVSAEAFTEPFEVLSRQDLGGRWRRSVRIAIAGLTAANSQLAAAVDAKRLCPQGAITRRGSIARNVLQTVYIDRIQSFHADLDRLGQSLLTRFSELAEATGRDSTSWHGFYRDLRHRQDALQRVSRRHAELWGNLLDQCGIGITPAP